MANPKLKITVSVYPSDMDITAIVDDIYTCHVGITFTDSAPYYESMGMTGEDLFYLFDDDFEDLRDVLINLNYENTKHEVIEKLEAIGATCRYL